MFQLGKTLVSEAIIEKDFVCNLSSCKGICCVEGDAGAPLEKKEIQILKDIYPKVKPFMTAKGIAVIDTEGTSITTKNGELETPLINNAACAYTIFDDKGVAGCAIEKAHSEGVIDWKKPISCHLYPIRVKDYSEFSAVNYHSWNICSDACTLGNELKVPVYKFVKNALIRKFGEKWYAELEDAAEKING